MLVKIGSVGYFIIIICGTVNPLGIRQISAHKKTAVAVGSFGKHTWELRPQDLTSRGFLIVR